MAEDPSSVPLLVHLTALLQAQRDLMEERDRRYQEARLAAARELQKTAEALQEYKVGANEWRDTVKDLIANLRESRSAAGGAIDAGKWIVAQTVAIVAALAGAGVYLAIG